MVEFESSLEPLPMQRFMHELVRRSSGLAKADNMQENSAKSVMDFDLATKNSSNNNQNKKKTESSDVDGTGSSHSNAGDTFDINGLVLVSDNARVFAKARPKPSRAPLTSASWHSSSELRKAHTAKSRWGGTPDGSPKFQNKEFRKLPKASTDNRFGPPSRPRSITRRTSDSCLSVPTRSWMKPQHRQSQQQSQQQQQQQQQQGVDSLPQHPMQRQQQHQSMQNVRARRMGQPVPPTRSSLPNQSASLVASRFLASPLEAALEARRSRNSRPPPPEPTSSAESLRSKDSCNSFKSFGSADSDEDLLDKASRVMNRPPRLAARDSRMLITVAKTTEPYVPSANSRWSPQTQEITRKSRTRPRQHSITNANRNALSNATIPADGNALSNASIPKEFRAQLPSQAKPQGFAPIPPSLLLPYDRFQASAPNEDSSGSLSSQDSRQRGPRLGRSRSSKSSGSRLSTRVRGSQSSLSSAGSGGSAGRGNCRNGLQNYSSRNSFSRNSISSRSNLLGSKSYHNFTSNSSFQQQPASNSLRSQSDHYSPVSTLELALGDMAPKRKPRGGRKTVSRARSSDY